MAAIIDDVFADISESMGFIAGCTKFRKGRSREVDFRQVGTVDERSISDLRYIFADRDQCQVGTVAESIFRKTRHVLTVDIAQVRTVAERI